MLTLRKFQDLWIGQQLQALVPEGTEPRRLTEWIFQQCNQHKTRDAANLLFAHYAPNKTDPRGGADRPSSCFSLRCRARSA